MITAWDLQPTKSAASLPSEFIWYSSSLVECNRPIIEHHSQFSIIGKHLKTETVKFGLRVEGSLLSSAF